MQLNPHVTGSIATAAVRPPHPARRPARSPRREAHPTAADTRSRRWRPVRRSLSHRTTGGHECRSAPGRCGPSPTVRNASVRCTKYISSLRITDPLKSMTASRRHTGPTTSPGATRSPVSSSSSRTAVCDNDSPTWAAPPMVNHQRGAGVAPPDSRRIRTAQQQHGAVVVEQHDTRRRAPRHRDFLARRHLAAFGDLEIAWQRCCSTEPQDAHRGAFPQRRACRAPRRCGSGGPAARALRRQPARRPAPPAATPGRPGPAPPTARSRRPHGPRAAPARRRRPLRPVAYPPVPPP